MHIGPPFPVGPARPEPAGGPRRRWWRMRSLRRARRDDVTDEQWATADGTLRATWALAAVAVLMPLLLFAAAAFVDRAAVLRRAEDDGRKTLALLHEQAANLLSGHEIVLDSVIARIRGLSWEAIASSPDLLRD